MTGSKLIKKASTYLGKGWKTFCNAYGFKYAVPWCCIYVYYIFTVCKISKLFCGGAKVCNCRVAFNWCMAHLKKVKMADAKAGDIVFFTWSGKGNNSFNSSRSIDHIGFIRKKGTSTVSYTIEGNTSGSSPAVTKVANRSRAKMYVLGIFRPKYPEKKKVEKQRALKDVAKQAKKRGKEHHKYKLGGWSWTKGIECHGFTGTVFKECGYPKVYKILKKKGFWRKFDTDGFLRKYRVHYNKKGVPASKMLPGDILLSSKAGHHSAIYIGDGLCGEAVRKGTRVAKVGRRFRYVYRVTSLCPEKKKRVYPEIPKRGYFKVGDKGVNVKRLQTLLNKAGFKCGKVDGIYGKKTESAVKKLQKKYDLTANGKYDKKSQAALKKALKK